MALEFKISLDASAFEQGFERAKQSGKSASDAIQAGLDQVSKSSSKSAGEVGKGFAKTESLAKKSFRGIGNGAKGVANKMTSVFKVSFSSIAKGFALMTAGFALKDSFANSLELEKTAAEVKTLSATVGTDINGIIEKTRLMAAEMGVKGVEATQSLYNAISSGIEPTKAVEFLQASANLATGGITNLDDATKVLTGSLNAFGKGGEKAAEFADILQTVVDKGSTKMQDLSAAMGDVNPISAASGLSFKETAASIATLTTVTNSASKAATGFKALLTAYSKPSAEASKLARELNIDFSANAIATKGIGGAMAELNAKMEEVRASGGNVAETMIKLTGSTEAQGAALILAASKFQTLNKNLVAFEKSSGAAEKAAKIMAQTLDAKLAKTTALTEIEMQKLMKSVRESSGEFIDAAGGPEGFAKAMQIARLTITTAFNGVMTGAMILIEGLTNAFGGAVFLVRTTVNKIVSSVKQLFRTFTGNGIIGEATKSMFPFLRAFDYLPKSVTKAGNSINNMGAQVNEFFSGIEQDIFSGRKNRITNLEQQAQSAQNSFNKLIEAVNAPINKGGKSNAIEKISKDIDGLKEKNKQANVDIVKDDQQTNQTRVDNWGRTAEDLARLDAEYSAFKVNEIESTNNEVKSIESNYGQARINAAESFGSRLAIAHEQAYSRAITESTPVLQKTMSLAIQGVANQISGVVATRQYSEAEGQRVLAQSDQALRMSRGFFGGAGGFVPGGQRQSFGVARLPSIGENNQILKASQAAVLTPSQSVSNSSINTIGDTNNTFNIASNDPLTAAMVIDQMQSQNKYNKEF